MVRLEITIKQIFGIATEVSIQEIGRKATKNEKDKLKAELEKLLKSL